MALALNRFAPGHPNAAYAVNAKAMPTGECITRRLEALNVPALWLNIGTDTGGGNGGDTQAPSSPTNLRVTTTTSSSVSLAWDASIDNVGLASYELTQNAAVIGSNASTTFTVSGLSPSTTFTVRVRDAAGMFLPQAIK